MHLLFIEYLPQIFTSVEQTENYDSDDLVAYGKKFTAIIIWTLENLEFLDRRTFAQLTLPCVGLQHKVKQKVEQQVIK